MARHIVKPEKLVATTAGMLEQELAIPHLFQKEGVDQFKDADNDNISIPVGGELPFHIYTWRNNRSAPITFDEYAEWKLAVTFGMDLYSAVRVADDHYDFVEANLRGSLAENGTNDRHSGQPLPSTPVADVNLTRLLLTWHVPGSDSPQWPRTCRPPQGMTGGSYPCTAVTGPTGTAGGSR